MPVGEAIYDQRYLCPGMREYLSLLVGTTFTKPVMLQGALISCCKGGQWQLALSVLDRMPKAAFKGFHRSAPKP